MIVYLSDVIILHVYIICRKTLSKMYTTFIQLLEYSSIVWDGCPLHYVEKLEKVQLYAARITPGLPIISSRESLYLETEWEPLSERRRVAKLNTMYKVHNNLVPDYLKHIFPSTRRRESKCNTRKGEDHTNPKYRLELYRKSFVPDTIKKWSSFNVSVRNIPSFSSFKNRHIHSKPPPNFSYGTWCLNINHTKLGHSCIFNYDFFKEKYNRKSQLCMWFIWGFI